MLSLPLYKKELKGTAKTLLILAAVAALYVSVIVSIYDPEAMALFDQYVEMMPGLMAALGMTANAGTLIGFMSSYLYGFLLLVLPMLFSMLTANKLVARYVDKGGMASLLAAPVRRSKIVTTQAAVLMTGIVSFIVFITVLELITTSVSFPGRLDVGKLLLLNFGLLCLQLFLGGVCFLFSCLFSDGKYAVGAGVGIPLLMFVLKMLSNTGEKAKIIKYVTFFSLFDSNGLISGNGLAIAGIFILLSLSAVLFYSASIIFCKKDMHV